MAENPPEIDSVWHGQAYFNWAWKGCGFGQLDFRIEDGTIRIANECMNREMVRSILVAFANHIADVGVLDDEPSNQSTS